jgi:signal transduction histidine kinase
MILDEMGLVPALTYLVDDIQKTGTPLAEFTHSVQFDRLASPLETAVFRIVQEGLANVQRHSNSPRVRVAMVQQGDRIRVEVEDWGIGFDPEKVQPNCFGLEGIRQRARLLGGSATIDSAPGKGTRITVDLPLVRDTATQNP